MTESIVYSRCECTPDCNHTLMRYLCLGMCRLAKPCTIYVHTYICIHYVSIYKHKTKVSRPDFISVPFAIVRVFVLSIIPLEIRYFQLLAHILLSAFLELSCESAAPSVELTGSFPLTVAAHFRVGHADLYTVPAVGDKQVATGHVHTVQCST